MPSPSVFIQRKYTLAKQDPFIFHTVFFNHGEQIKAWFMVDRQRFRSDLSAIYHPSSQARAM